MNEDELRYSENPDACEAEIEKDLHECIDDVDFKHYDPYSKPYMRILFLGQMWQLLCDLGKKEKKIQGDVAEELSGARKYFADYKATGDINYRDMASDELRHAGILIKKHIAKAGTQDERDMLNALEAERQKLHTQIMSGVPAV